MERFPTVEAQEVSSQFCSYEILFAFKKMFNTHLLTMLCGACFLQAARAWPEEILCKVFDGIVEKSIADVFDRESHIRGS
mmetsp:Transcript_38363/g.78504  ORF Transcript_38363/g.78504 Transcript_38363/m.78504 type:complete len:80 (+) Transcript_38363:141-380(+)